MRLWREHLPHTLSTHHVRQSHAHGFALQGDRNTRESMTQTETRILAIQWAKRFLSCVACIAAQKRVKSLCVGRAQTKQLSSYHLA